MKRGQITIFIVVGIVILAAGIGKRLGYITEDTPKPMIKLKGKPILEHNIIMCRKAGIREILYL